MIPNNKAVTFLWFKQDALVAARFYVSLFENALVTSVTLGHDGQPRAANFCIGTQEFIAFNGGPHFSLNEAASIYVNCTSQAEIDRLWTSLSQGGQELRCGWVRDRFGLCWQIIPDILIKRMHDPDPVAARRVVDAMMAMVKIDITSIERAYRGTE